MKKRSENHLKNCLSQGFSLVEVALALAVAAFCLLTLIALLPVGLQSYQKASNESVMVNLATMVVRDLQATATSATASPSLKFTIPAAGGGNSQVETFYADASGVPTGKVDQPATPNSIYRVNVAFYPPPANQKLATTARIQITSPAQADTTPLVWSTKYSNIFQTMVSLNRN